MKTLKFIKQSNGSHWVGDGFPVRNIFSYEDIADEISPFLLMDYAGPKNFAPTEKKLGVGEHPHRGFETVTILYEGEVEHRDSGGGGGKIGPGEVQWMTAGAGVVHEEYHGRDFAKKGGTFEVVQLWVNLPKKDKMTEPRYQALTKEGIPEVVLPNGDGVVRVIAGEYHEEKGPASTFSAINLWDVRLYEGKSGDFEFEENETVCAFVLSGEIETSDGHRIHEAEMGVFHENGTKVTFKAIQNSKVLILNGNKLNEPIVGYGPFVMNTEAEIRQAYADYRSGKMGKLAVKS
jgi:redox-sensitive bicupin YhaK (pirin superfamily)